MREKRSACKSIVVLWLALFVLAGCNKSKVRISGQFDNCRNDYFVLYQIFPGDLDGLEQIDTVALLNGHFLYSIKTGQIGVYLMKFSDTVLLPFIADKGEKLVFSGDARHLPSHCEVQGSEETALLWQNNRKLDTLYLKIKKLSNEFIKYAGEHYSDSVIAVLDSMYYAYFNAHKEYLTHFILSNPDRLAALLAFYQTLGNNPLFTLKEDGELLRKIYPFLSKRYPNSIYVEDIQDKLENLHD
ncbi:MAG: DUF4369 domain-containing protein [Bacteroidales bacterium]|jgi:hypothetical protein|nr:DUF4369 domain-containing protein [Bacteroidales bacterium]